MKRPVNSYIDILVDENIASAKEVLSHLKYFRLTAKSVEAMEWWAGGLHWE